MPRLDKLLKLLAQSAKSLPRVFVQVDAYRMLVLLSRSGGFFQTAL